MYSFSYLEPVCCSMSSSNCYFLNCIQIFHEAGEVVWYSHPFKNFPQFIVIHTVKGFGIVNKTKVDVFLELSHFFNDPTDVGNLISCSSAFSKTSLNIWKFTVRVLLKPGLDNYVHYFTIKMWGTWEGNGKPLQYSCLENPMNSVKRQKDRTLKDELPTLVGGQYATGEEGRNNSRKNEDMEPKWKQCPVVDVTGDGRKVWCCKEQYCIGT